MKLYCPDVFTHAAITAKEERPIIFGNKLSLTCVHRCECVYISSYVGSICLCLCPFLSMIVDFSFADLLLLEDDYGSRRFLRSHTSCDTWELLSNTASCCQYRHHAGFHNLNSFTGGNVS